MSGEVFPGTDGLVPNRIVVKVGTSTLTHPSGALNLRSFDRLARVLSDTSNLGFEVILVSSGAIAVGSNKLRLSEPPKELRMKQAAAATGQCELMHLYDKSFAEYGKTVAQILLTGDDVEYPETRRNLIGTFDALLSLGVIPVVNENDSVSFKEIEDSPERRIFGDNDTLSAVVARLTRARLLVLMSDIDGLYDSDPHINPDARLIPVITDIDDGVLALAGGSGTRRGTGGMITKLYAARLAASFGIDMVITNGSRPEALYDIAEGKSVGTLFSASRG